MSKINISDLTSGQKRALDSMLAGGNVFLTGEAGTGKSVVTEIFIEKSTRDRKSILITAPTGTAADNLHGETIHRCFGADIGIQKNNRVLSSRKDILRTADIVIIDEISMCRFDLFDYVARRILYENECRAKDREFTKIRHTSVIQEGDKTYSVKQDDIQLIVLGDFYQLPPVITKDDMEEFKRLNPGIDENFRGYAFQSECWSKMNFESIMLTEVVRQSDSELAEILHKVRQASSTASKKECIDWLMSRSSTFPMPADDSIYLFGTNKKCKEINDKELLKLHSKEETYIAGCTGEIEQGDKFAEDEIILKEGCKVMLTVNDSSGRYVNGTIGRVVSLRDESIDVLKEDGKLITIEPLTKEITKPVVKEYEVERLVDEAVLDEDGLPKRDADGNVIMQKVTKMVTETEIAHEKVGSFTQLPVRIAYAITIHKSQGKTFSKINLDPYVWDDGQFYTALSRCKAIEDVCILNPILPKYIKTSADVKKFMKPIEKAVSGSWS